ncbi:MAG: DUF3500 domain-containing protein, partial [Planctomycetaceae bacterium]
KLLASLNAEQKKICSFKFDDPERLNWHFIPRERKGVAFRGLEGDAFISGRSLLSAGLSGSGYEQVLKVMSLEEVLYLIEGGEEGKRRDRRHPHKYHISIFGTPGKNAKWGWRVEGHHLSLNYVIKNNQFVASTPEFLGANPGQISAGPGRLLRVLGEREDLGRQILKLCNDDQKKVLWISEKAPGEIRTPGEPQPKVGKPEGLAFAKMTKQQQDVFRKLLRTYLLVTPPEIMKKRLKAIEAGGIGNLHFAWWGGPELNQPHHYRIQGPTFIVEYNNVQNDANHVHSIWRNVAGDFGVPRK